MTVRRPTEGDKVRRLAGWSVAVLLLALFLVGQPRAGPTTHPGAGPTTPHASALSGSARGHAVLALGDSVPAGAACDCQPFPETYGALLHQRLGVPVTVQNRAVSGLDTAGVIAQLRSPEVADLVRRSDVVLLTIGANDFGDHHDQIVTGQCGRGDADCVADEVSSLSDHLDSVLAAIRSLRAGQQTSVLVTGYWNVFEDGDVARRVYGEAGLQASLRVTRRVNAVIQQVTAARGARYVDLLGAFQRSGEDVTSLMAADGDHPNAAGHAQIAHALLDAGLPRLR